MELRESLLIAGTAAVGIGFDRALPWVLGIRRSRALRRVLDLVFVAGFLVTTAVAMASSWQFARMLSGLDQAYCRTHPWETRCR
jgi:hypothetical protein